MPNPKLETYKNKATGTVYDYTDAAAQAALAGILDGTDIESFEDVETALATKVDKVTGKGLSTNDYDDTEKAKVAGAFPRSEQAVLGAKNLAPLEYDGYSNNLDVTLTVNSDMSITLNGTQGANGGQYYLSRRQTYKYRLNAGSYKVSGAIANKVTLAFYKNKVTGDSSQGFDEIGIDSGNGLEFSLSQLSDIQIQANIAGNATFNNETIYPLITVGTDNDRTWTSPVMTNEQLTENARVKTIAHATAITEGDLSVTFTEYITGNVEQIVGVISSSVDKDIASQSGISIGTALAHKPLSSAEVIGSIDSSLSASDRRPICSIRISNTGRISIDGQMSANRNYTFTITYIFGS